MTEVSVTTRELNVGGLSVKVYSSKRPQATSLPIAVLFLIHGRLESAARYTDSAHRIIEEVDSLAANGGAKKNLLVVTFDQRNHGTRLVDVRANLGWDLKDVDKHNPNHALDMYAIQVGTARDVSYLIDFLPDYLEPNGQQNVTEWIVSGISLGGHVSWIVLKNEPRVKIGIPVIGSPSYKRLMEIRAGKSSIELEPPYYPPTLGAYVDKHDPATAPAFDANPNNPFLSKRILVLSGGKDRLVYWEAGEEFIEKLDVGPDGVKKVIIEAEAGHEFTPKMRNEMARFVWEHSVSQAVESDGSTKSHY